LLPLPRAGEGRGEGEGVSYLPYFFQYSLCLAQDVVVPEPQGLKTQGSHVATALLVIATGIVFCMLAAIQFNDQAYFKTCEVSEIRANRMLTPKLQISDQATSQL